MTAALRLVGGLLLGLLELGAWPVVLIALVAIGMTIGLWLFGRLFAHEEKRADQLVTRAEEGPTNVVYLTPAIAAEHAARRVANLLDHS